MPQRYNCTLEVQKSTNNMFIHNLLWLIAKTGLMFCNPFVILGLILIGFLSGREKIFVHALFLVLFTVTYNLYLKTIFKVPLPPPLEGFAFPSGHMHSAVIFWGWLALKYPATWARGGIVLMLTFAGYGLVYEGYHYPIDILGSLAFGSLTLIIYKRLTQIQRFQIQPYLLGVILCLINMGLIFMLPIALRKPPIWVACGGLIGLTSGWFVGLRQASSSLAVSDP